MERGDCPHGYKFSCPVCHQKPREIAEARDVVHSSYVEGFRKKDATIKQLQAKNKNLRKENAAQAEALAAKDAEIARLKAERDEAKAEVERLLIKCK